MHGSSRQLSFVRMLSLPASPPEKVGISFKFRGNARDWYVQDTVGLCVPALVPTTMKGMSCAARAASWLCRQFTRLPSLPSDLPASIGGFEGNGEVRQKNERVKCALKGGASEREQAVRVLSPLTRPTAVYQGIQQLHGVQVGFLRFDAQIYENDDQSQRLTVGNVSSKLVRNLFLHSPRHLRKAKAWKVNQTDNTLIHLPPFPPWSEPLQNLHYFGTYGTLRTCKRTA